MTIQEVDSKTFYAVGKGLFEKAGKLYDAFNVNVNILGGTGSMAGTDDAGKAWATSYDERVKEVLGAVNDLTKALENYGGVVTQAGYNHAVAEHNATPGNQGPAPAMPPEPASTAGVLSAPPSAGGPGRGLVDAIGLMQQVGVPVPDGDTDKVSKAADAWDRLATVYQTKTIAEGLEVDARTFLDTHSPEVEYIVQDLEELRDAMTIRNGRMRRAVPVVQRLQVRARRSAYATRGHPGGSGDRTRGHCGDRHRRVVRLLRCAAPSRRQPRRPSRSPNSRASSPKPLVRGRSRRTSPAASRKLGTSPGCARSCSESSTWRERGSRRDRRHRHLASRPVG